VTGPSSGDRPAEETCGSLIPFAWHEQVRCRMPAGHDADHWCEDTGWSNDESATPPAVRAGDDARCSGDGCWYTLPVVDGLVVAHSAPMSLDHCEGSGRPPLSRADVRDVRIAELERLLLVERRARDRERGVSDERVAAALVRGAQLGAEGVAAINSRPPVSGTANRDDVARWIYLNTAPPSRYPGEPGRAWLAGSALTAADQLLALGGSQPAQPAEEQ
jgi:hypothetical protein